MPMFRKCAGTIQNLVGTSLCDGHTLSFLIEIDFVENSPHVPERTNAGVLSQYEEAADGIFMPQSTRESD